MIDYIVLSIPVFFILIGVELGYSRAKGLRLYRLSDSLASMGTGVIDQVGTALVNALFAFTAYAFVYERWAFWSLEKWPPLHWAVGFVGADLCYYWWHRKAHEVNFIWAAHVVHHQSEEYNLSTALRQSPMTLLTSWLFYLPLAFIGVSPAVFAASKSFMILYQFWIHTRAIPTLGAPIEAVFNTPSHHRVHHGINPRYIDKNYAGTFIVWDRMFGTFEPESEPVCYGVLKPIKSWNPVRAVLQHWVTLVRSSWQMPRLADKLRVWYKHPGWAPENVAPFDIHLAYDEVRRSRFDVPLSKRRAWYLAAQFALVLGGASALLFNQSELGIASMLTAAALVFLSLFSLAEISEKKPLAIWLEAGRVSLFIGIAVVAIWKQLL